MLRGWTTRFLPSVLHEPCSPTPVSGVHGIATYAWFFMLKKSNFNLILNFHDSNSQSGPSLRTLINSRKNKLNSKISWFFNLEPNAHFF